MKRVYIAGPLFCQAEREFLERLVARLSEAAGLDARYDFYLPHRDGEKAEDVQEPGYVFQRNLTHLEMAELVVGVLDGQDVDSGTAIELGYAYAKDKPILALLTDTRARPPHSIMTQRPNLMVSGVCENAGAVFASVDDLVRAFTRAVLGDA
ncbi:MAG: nucleoside 2-deoxyribosyltransferase [bacterium]